MAMSDSTLVEKLNARALELREAGTPDPLLQMAATRIEELAADVEHWRDEEYRARNGKYPPGIGD